MILVSKFMISDMENLMIKTTIHFRWWPSWIFKRVHWYITCISQ